MKILVTGGCGFIGSNFVRYLLKTPPDYSVINVDKLTYAGNLENLSGLSNAPRYHFIRADITDGPRMEELIAKGVKVTCRFPGPPPKGASNTPTQLLFAACAMHATHCHA